ncbi:MAG: hypothetical protein ACRDP6_38555 [Actinoallomurus sp.]
MKHALAVLAGIAVGLPVMAALASVNGHTAGALPDRYVPWAQQRLRSRYSAIRAPARRDPRTARPAHVLVSTSPRTGPAAEPVAPMHLSSSPLPLPGRPARHVPSAGLHVSIEAPRTVRPGGTYAYRIRLTNHGSETPGEITVRNTLPEGVVRTGASLPGGVGGYAGGRDATLVMPRLAPGRSATARFVVRVRKTARGRLVARSRIASVDGERAPRGDGNVATAATRVRERAASGR